MTSFKKGLPDITKHSDKSYEVKSGNAAAGL